ncbi:hypothetical protein F4775DRAFT_541873 [Biscogniauxia sp. FL1348]|nr:hypothetical protein F4775DRAFT_541873 [Biscogniauxia sp. FL1348]
MFGKLLLTGNLVWVVAMTFVRLSILSLYIHIFSLHDRFRIACYVLMAAAVSWGVAVFILLALDCQPFAFNWDKTIPGGYCVNIAASYLSAHVINLTIDSSIAFLPTPVLWGLHMPLRRKIGITILFALGSAVCVFSLIRIALYRIVLGFDSIDFTWTAPTPVIFTVGEPSLGCVIACLPLLRPIAEKFSSSQAGSWIKSWVSSISGTTKVTKGSSFEDGNPKDNYQVAVKTGVSADGQWQRLSDDQRAIMVSHEYDQQSYSMGEISR